MMCYVSNMNHNLLGSDILQHNRKTVLTTSIVIKTLFEYRSFLVSWVEVFSVQSREKSQFMGS